MHRRKFVSAGFLFLAASGTGYGTATTGKRERERRLLSQFRYQLRESALTSTPEEVITALVTPVGGITHTGEGIAYLSLGGQQILLSTTERGLRAKIC
ncbi:hypothetical protein GGR28_003599 [Lewinella aquimaris]|uniref:Uncharacterized protein n=1 Tax=Neolewinella aquimaris TaxID=1835722 RepID=A0A840EGC9_9BACT|nr:hypothetical protein [Neolewinella aquimaris]MBB4080958.1 hypothetical protein [Neolewinella aquimaris]